MHSLFGSRKVVKVILLQTWPTAKRRSGMMALARLDSDGRISLHDFTRKYPDEHQKPFYPDAKEGVHFKSMETYMVELFGNVNPFDTIDWNQEPISDEHFFKLFGVHREVE